MTTNARASRRAVLVALAAGAGCLGPSGSPESVTVMAFEDYACPHCRTYVLDVLPKLAAEYLEPGAVRYEHHDFPIPVDGKWSWAAAGAARAVQDTVGDDAFFEYSELLFENQDRYSMDLVGRLAEQVGADPGTVRAAARSDKYRPVLQADRERGEQLELGGTPEIFVDGEKTDGHSFDTVASAIEAATN